MEDPIIIGTNKDVSPFESEACEKYLQSFQLNLEEIVPLTEPKESKPDPDETPSVEAASIPLKVQSRRPTLEINGVQVKPKTLADYREAIRKSLDGKISDEIVNDENKSRTKNLRRHTIESPLVSEKKNVKVLGEHCNKKTAKSNSNQKSPKVKEEPNSENTVTRSGRVSKKVLKVETGKEKHKKQEDEETEHQNETTSKKTVKQCPDSDYFPNTFLRPDSKVQVEAVDSKVVMYTGAGRHLHSYAIHNYNLLTENTFDVTAWQRDFALTALNNNIDSSGRSIFRSTVPLVSTNLIQIKNDLKEGKIDCKLNKTDLGRNERLHNRSRRRKKRKAVWTKQKTHSIPVMNAKKMKEDVKDVSIESDKDDDVDIEDLSTDKEDRLETSPQIKDEVPTLKRKLNPNEEDDLYREMYGTPHKRVKLKLIQTQSDSNKKPQWTSVNYEKEIRPEETEDEMSNIVSTVMDNMLNYVELNNDYNEKDVTLDPTYFEEYKLESEDSTDLPKQLKRKRNNSSRVKWELKRLDVLIFEHESEGNKNGDGTCSNDFCKLGCICESISVRPKNIAINHCSEINCIFKCVCPAPRRNEHKPPIRDESEIIRSVAEKRNGRNLAKKEKEWIQTLVKTNDEYIIMQSSTGNKNKREVKKPERYREESLHWENVAHQKFLYEKVKRNLREKAKKANNDDSSPPAEDEDTESSPVNEESSTVSLKDKQRAEIKLLKRLRKKKRLQMEMLQQQKQEEQSEESKPNKTSPFKFYFCKEHMVLDCKCKAKKETKEEKEMDTKLKQLEEDISALTSNLGNLSSKEKDKLLSLMREQQTLTESKEKANVRETVRKDEVAPPTGMDEEYIDLNTLSKFIPHPDEDQTGDNQDGTDVKDHADNLAETKADPSQSESTDHDHTQENETRSSALQDDNPANIKTKPVTSLRPHEVNDPEEKDDEVEVLDSGMSGGSANSQQGLGNLSLNSIQSLLNQKAPFTNATKLPIDFYGFMLHNGIGYLPISQYSPNQLYMIFKNPTKRDPLPIIFHGPDYLQKASTWANGFLQGYVKFHPKSQNPCWKIIKFSNMQELKNWKLFDFKFLKDFSPMVLTDEGMYKVKGKILYKLLLLPQERTFKFKQVMEAKLDMDDLSFIEKYEYFHNCRDTLPSNKPIRFIQRTQLLGENEPQDGLSAANEISGMSDNQLSEETGGSTPTAVMPKVSPNGSTAPIILSKSSPNAAQTIVVPKVSPTATSQPLIVPQFSPTVSLPNLIPKTSPSTTVQHKPSPSPAVHSGGIFIKPADALLQRPRATPATPASQALHRQNIINNLNRLALSRVQSAQAMSRGGGGMFQGFQPQGRPPTARGMLGYIPRPRVAPVGKKPPPPYPAHLNPAVVKVDNLERYKQFIQISDIVTTPSPARTPPPTAQSKSHPILSKSLATPTLPLGDAPVCIEKLAPAKPDSDIESNLDTYRITKISAEDTNNNRNSPVPRKYIQPNRHIQSQGAFPVSTSLMNTFRPANSPILSIPKSAISSMTSISPMSALPRSSSSPSSSHTVTSLTSSPMNGAFSSPMPSAVPKRAPVPGLKPIKKPLPGLKAINPAGFASPVAPSKRLTEEVDISMSPVKNQTGRDHARRRSTAEPECLVEEFPLPRYRAAPPPPPELSIVECLTRMENTPITFTPNGEDTVTISPIVVSSHTTGGARPPYKEKMGATVFERLSAVKRLNDGESIHVIARSMNVSEDSVAQWARNFERLQKRTGHRAMMSGGTVHSFNGTVHSFNGTPES